MCARINARFALREFGMRITRTHHQRHRLALGAVPVRLAKRHADLEAPHRFQGGDAPGETGVALDRPGESQLHRADQRARTRLDGHAHLPRQYRLVCHHRDPGSKVALGGDDICGLQTRLLDQAIQNVIGEVIIGLPTRDFQTGGGQRLEGFGGADLELESRNTACGGHCLRLFRKDRTAQCHY